MIDASVLCQLVAENQSTFLMNFLRGHVSFFVASLRSEVCLRMIAGLHGTGFPFWNDCGTHSFDTCPWVR